MGNMGIRDEEIKRLERYAQGLGTKVTYKDYKRGDAGAEWVIHEDNTTELIVYIWPRQSKVRTILNLIHELGHHLAWIHNNRKEDPATLDAFYREGERSRKDPTLVKRKRKLIYESEKNDAEYRDIIWHEVGIKIPKWRLEHDKELDIWGYLQYYKTGEHPNITETHSKGLELKKEMLGKNKE